MGHPKKSESALTPEDVVAQARNERGFRVSQRLNQVAQAEAQRFGDPQQGVDADPLLAALNFPNVHGMQVGLLRKFFLAQAGPLAMLADGFPKNFKLLSRTRHRHSAKQEAAG